EAGEDIFASRPADAKTRKRKRRNDEICELKIQMNVLVTGGAGYIGSVVVEELISAGDEVFVLDDLSKGHREMVATSAGFVQGNIRDSALVEKTLTENHIEAVVHMAASSLVGESVKFPD